MKKLISLVAMTVLMLSILAIPAWAAELPTTFTVREPVACNSCSQCLGLDGQTAAPCGSYIVPVWVTNNGPQFLTGATFEITIDDSKLEWFFPRGKAAYNTGTSVANQRSWPYLFEDEALLGLPIVRPSAGQFDGNKATFNLANTSSEKEAEAFIFAVRVKPKASFTNGSAAITLDVKSPVGSTDPGVVVSSSISNITVTSGKISKFGDVPKTGIPDMATASILLFVFIIISATLWSCILYRRLRRGYRV